MLAELQRRQENVANVILTETKPGDLIMLEGPLTKTPWEELVPTLKTLDEAHKELFVRHADFYLDIANYARSIGRRAASVDSGLNSRFGRIGNFLYFLNPAHKEEAQLAIEHQRNRVMEARIKGHNPKLVVTTMAHIHGIIHTVQPTKLITTNGKIYPGATIREASLKAHQKRLPEIEKLEKLRLERQRLRREALKKQSKPAPVKIHLRN